jgi:hypothetical protein
VSTRERETLLEAAVTAFRERDFQGRIVPPPAWWDLSAEDRKELFERQLSSRLLEKLAHPTGLSATARAVMSRIYKSPL